MTGKPSAGSMTISSSFFIGTLFFEFSALWER